MRIHALALALALVASPALADHKPNHPAPAQRPIQIALDPCGAANNPHVQASERALTERCRALRADLERSPGDSALRARCDRAAIALTGRPCGEPARASAPDR
jgi:hypothetical protein